MKDKVVGFVRSILIFFDPNIVIQHENYDGILVLDIQSSDPSLLIGKHGKNLSALQSLIEVFCRRNSDNCGDIFFVVVDIQGFRKERLKFALDLLNDAIKQIADSDVESVALPITDSFMRKVLHSYIAKRMGDRFYTESFGEGDGRKMYLKKV